MNEEGQKVRVRGRSGTYIATIVGEGEKNGNVVYDMDNEHWCYEDQIINVIKE